MVDQASFILIPYTLHLANRTAQQLPTRSPLCCFELCCCCSYVIICGCLLVKWEGRTEGRIVHGSQIKKSPSQVSSPFHPKIMFEQITFQVHLYYYYTINTRTMLLFNFHLFYIGFDQQVVRMLTLRHVDLSLASIFEHNIICVSLC